MEHLGLWDANQMDEKKQADFMALASKPLDVRW
jgi:hypothetical protein